MAFKKRIKRLEQELTEQRYKLPVPSRGFRCPICEFPQKDSKQGIWMMYLRHKFLCCASCAALHPDRVRAANLLFTVRGLQ